jgi:hypothetical protein
MATQINPDGFATRMPGQPNGVYPRILPFDVWSSYYEDFFLGSSGIPFGWTNTNTNGTPTNASGSTLVQTLGGADNDVSHMYATTATFTTTAGKKACFSAKIKVSKGASGTIGLEEVFVGVGTAQTTTNFVAADGSSLTVDNCIGFWSDPTAGATIHCVCRASDVESVVSAAGTYVDATYTTLSWDYDGTSVYFYQDNNLIATITASIPAADMTPMLMIKAGEAKAKVLSTHYIFCATEN